MVYRACAFPRSQFWNIDTIFKADINASLATMSDQLETKMRFKITVKCHAFGILDTIDGTIVSIKYCVDQAFRSLEYYNNASYTSSQLLKVVPS